MENNKKPPVVRICSRVSLEYMLRDTRYTSNQYVFGKVGQVAKQYGVKVIAGEGYNSFEAPRSRMQLFVEKLHFAAVPFFEQS